jgi:hypothetical protein
LTIKLAIGHQQPNHDVAVELAINTHRQFVHAKRLIQLTGGLPRLNQLPDKLEDSLALLAAFRLTGCFT